MAAAAPTPAQVHALNAMLADIYRRDVIGGPGAFVIVTDDYVAFKAAIFTMLTREIA